MASTLMIIEKKEAWRVQRSFEFIVQSPGAHRASEFRLYVKYREDIVFMLDYGER